MCYANKSTTAQQCCVTVVTVERKNNDDELSPKIKKLAGSLKMPKDFDYEKALDDYYKEKYNL